MSMGAAESLYEEILKGGYARIDRFVTDSQAETLYLDFKEKDDRRNGVHGPSELKNYSEALSGFANSAGGVIVWGVQCKTQTPGDSDVASKLKPITGHRAFMTNLNSLASQLVYRTVEGVDNQVVDDSMDPTGNSGFVISLIPASDIAPHCALANDKRVNRKYFKRNVSSFLQMEPFDLEDMFGRRRGGRFEVEFTFQAGWTQGGEAMRLVAMFHVQNVGRHAAEQVAVRFDAGDHGFSWHPEAPWTRVDRRIFALPNVHVVYPATTLTAALGEWVFRKAHLPQGPLRISGTVFSTNSSNRNFSFQFYRVDLERAGASELPPGAFEPASSPA